MEIVKNKKRNSNNYKYNNSNIKINIKLIIKIFIISKNNLIEMIYYFKIYFIL